MIEKHTDYLIEQKKPQKTLEHKLNRQMQTFSFDPPINQSQEDKWLLTVSGFKTTNFVFNITDENKSFSSSTPGYWSSRGGAETFEKLQIFF